MKDNRMGEEICACIRLKKGEKTTAEEIKAFCKGKVGASSPHFPHPHPVPCKPMLLGSPTPSSLPTSHPTVPSSPAWDPTQPHA